MEMRISLSLLQPTAVMFLIQPSYVQDVLTVKFLLVAQM